jgi:acyl-homoserine lactone acylase PvdQ
MSVKRAVFAWAVVLTLFGAWTTAAAVAAPQPEPYRSGDFGGFRNVLPPGQNGYDSLADIFAFQASGATPPHWLDQSGMYGNLVYSSPGLKAADVPKFFKDGSFGVRPDDVDRVYSPPLRPGVTIVRDKSFGVPHVYGETRADVEYAAGYVSAEDRLFFMDALRHSARGQLSGFAGGTNRAMDQSVWRLAPYNEADIQRQYDLADEVYGADGAQAQQDTQAYVDGVNAYILEARVNPNKMPGEYAAIGKPLEDWKVTDPLVTASLIAGIFGRGGGAEVNNALALQAAQKRFGRRAGESAWRDFREADDPESPSTVRGKSFPYGLPRGGLKQDALALPDPGSVVDPSPSSPAPSLPTNQGLFAGLLQPRPSASNALLVSGAKTDSGRPLAVFGPQVSYWIPEILLEVDLHCLGDCQGQPDIDARGATFPGVSQYVLLGRGKDYAWSATTSAQDVTDTFAEVLCEPDGSQPTVQSMHYLYKGQCLDMEVLTRTNVVTPNAADQCSPDPSSANPCGVFTMEAQRTLHGIVQKRGTVDGTPVAFVTERSSYFHEADSALAFAQMNDPKRMKSAQDFQQAMYRNNLTFNWFYADDRDIAYFNSGSNPVRARGVDPDLPTWGTGAYDWQSFDPVLQQADQTPFSQHPRTINQTYLSSWNNKQALGYRAADDNYTYGPAHRVQLLDRRIDQRLASGDKFSLPELIDAMEDGGTVDLRAQEVLPWMLNVVGSPAEPALADAVAKLRTWVAAGGHRRDCTPVPPACTPDGRYEHERAIEIMDAWWPRAVAAAFMPALGGELYEAILRLQPLDNTPNRGDHFGSAYQFGWYGYMQKDLRSLLGQPVKGAYSRRYCGGGTLTACRAALRASLAEALTVAAATLYDEKPGESGTQRIENCPSANTDQWCFDSVRYHPVGGISADTFHWINRPTWQQAVEVQGHRPR